MKGKKIQFIVRWLIIFKVNNNFFLFFFKYSYFFVAIRSNPDPETEESPAWNEVLNPFTIKPIVVSDIRHTTSSIQDTPTRAKIQRQINELNIFEHFAGFKNTAENDKPINRINLPSPHSSDSDDESATESTAPKVRFCLQVEEVAAAAAAAADNDCTTLLSIDNVQPTTSTPIQKNTDENLLANDTTDMAQLLKAKLIELEKEIIQFRQQNAELTKHKQRHELERVQLAEERAEQLNAIQDERIRMEVELHDERIRIAEDRAELQRKEKLLRGPNRKEREDTIALRTQLEAAQKELVAKDGRHVAAQARLRAQIRVLEKDLKECSYEVEQLKKENRKVESENVRLRRQSNNKMLMAINRNIAKLSTGGGGDAEINVKEKEFRGRKEVVTEKQQESSESEEEDVVEDVVALEQIVKAAPTATKVVADSRSSVKREIINKDGSKDVWYPNGNIKKISADTMVIRMLYYNKDIKETNIQEGTVRYYYAETNTWHTSYLDGLEILEFPK